MTESVARAVLLVGPVGSGKTAIAMELGELLSARSMPHAVIDLDWLGWFDGPAGAPTPHELIVDNLRTVWPRFRSAGARYLVMARALVDPAEVDDLKAAVPDAEVTVAVVRASAAAIAQRLGRRDDGGVLSEHLAESAAMAAALAKEPLEGLEVDNETTTVADATRTLLERLGWA
jgi:adenylylsulfate kinase